MAGPGSIRQPCPVCGQVRAVYRAEIGAPGYGQGGECRGCGAGLWRANCAQEWIAVADMDGPPELSIEDVR